MPIYYPNTRFSDCWSSVGDITFFHKDGKCYFRKKAVHKFSGTAAQLDEAQIHHRAILAWQSLEPEVQDVWREYAKDVPAKRPPYDHQNHISGYNLFVSAYHGHALLGNECVPQPSEMPVFPDFDLRYRSARVEADCLVLCFDAMMADESSRFRVLGKLVVTAPGKGCKTSKLRNYLMKDGEFRIPLPDLNLADGFQIHMRYLLVDSVTGFRCHYKTMSITAVL